MIKIPKKYYTDLAKVPKRVNKNDPGIHADSKIIITVCIRKFSSPKDPNYPTKEYLPLNIYFGIHDIEDFDRSFWIYSNKKILEYGYWFSEEEFETHFRFVQE